MICSDDDIAESCVVPPIPHEIHNRIELPFCGAIVTTCAVQGFGNVGSISAKLIERQGVAVVAISDISGAYYNPDGLDIEEAIKYVQKHNSLEGYKAGKMISNDDLLELDVDILVPAALEDQITEENAARIKAKLIVEGANGPTASSPTHSTTAHPLSTTANAHC